MRDKRNICDENGKIYLYDFVGTKKKRAKAPVYPLFSGYVGDF